MAEKKRVKIPALLNKRIFQETSSMCAFCPETEITSLQIHHIDGDPSNNVFENLIVACASCHSKITGGVLSNEAVSQKKRELKEKINRHRDVDAAKLQIEAAFEMRNSGKREIVLVISVVNTGRRSTFVRRVFAFLEPMELHRIDYPSIKLKSELPELNAAQKDATVKIESDGGLHVWQILFPQKPSLQTFEKDGECYGSGALELTTGERLKFEFLLLPDSAWSFLHAPIMSVFDRKTGYKCPGCGFVFLVQALSQSGGAQSSVTCPQCKHISNLKPS